MESKLNYQLPPGRQPYDPLNGFRVGAFAGGLIGAAIAVIAWTPWILLVGAAIGGAVGYVTERRKLHGNGEEPSPSSNGDD